MATFIRNWENNIYRVQIESCDPDEDPLGFKAVFYFEQEAALQARRKSFVIGASFLSQRQKNLVNAGYEAPMTHKAISLIEDQLGKPLERLAHA